MYIAHWWKWHYFICRLKFDDANDLLDKYYAIAKDSGGDITYDEFAKYLHLPKSDALEEVFNLYDRVIWISEFFIYFWIDKSYFLKKILR